MMAHHGRLKQGLKSLLGYSFWLFRVSQVRYVPPLSQTFVQYFLKRATREKKDRKHDRRLLTEKRQTRTEKKREVHALLLSGCGGYQVLFLLGLICSCRRVVQMISLLLVNYEDCVSFTEGESRWHFRCSLEVTAV
jgi:hypothetical protein